MRLVVCCCTVVVTRNNNDDVGRRVEEPRQGAGRLRAPSQHDEWIDTKRRTCRILAAFLIFVAISLYRLNQTSFLSTSFLALDHTSRNQTTVTLPLVRREWDRMLFGIFSFDSPNEVELRRFNRETHLSYFRTHLDAGGRPDVICSLREVLDNATLAMDPESCRIIYTFVIGGGIGDESMTKKKAAHLKDGKNSVFATKTRCLFEDTECGGTDISKWTLDSPKCNVSETLADELLAYNDMTLLSIPENHELGKTDTWFTYATMLTLRPELQIGFVGKMDSDTFVRWPVFFQYLEFNWRRQIETMPFIYGGWAIHKEVCSQKAWGQSCAVPAFIAEMFATGAFAYLSTPLAQHVFLNGTTLQRKRDIWIVGEDMQLANMAYSDPNRPPFVISHRHGRYGNKINVHCFSDAERCRREYYESYPEQRLSRNHSQIS